MVSLRQESLGKEEENRKSETFRWNPAGTNPAWRSRASSQKRVLRGGGATHAAKRRQPSVTFSAFGGEPMA